MHSSLHAGVSAVALTPPVGIPMGGYGGRQGVSQGVHDQLEARALVLAAGGKRIGLVVCDLLALDLKTLQTFHHLAAQPSRIPSSHLLVAVTHTHSGPAYGEFAHRYMFGPMPHPPSPARFARWEAELPHAMGRAVQQAEAALQPVQMAAAVATVRAAVNRRLPDAFGEIRLHPNPDGPIDPDALVVRFETPEGQAVATLIAYACHPVVLCEDNLELSADFPYFVRRHVEQSSGGLALYLNGACGNLNPRQRGDFVVAQEIGEEIATAALAALKGAPRKQPAMVTGGWMKVQCPARPLPSLAAAERYVEVTQRAMAGHPNVDNYERRRLRAEAERAKQQLHRHQYVDRRLELLRAENRQISAIVQVLAVGEVVLLGFPGEMFVELGLSAKGRYRRPYCGVVGYTNELIGYVPTESAYREGGYEVDSALVGPGAGERLVEAVVSLAHQIQGA